MKNINPARFGAIILATLACGSGMSALAQQSAPAAKPSLPRTVEVTEYESHADPKALSGLLRRRVAIEAQVGSSGKVRFWKAGLCGARSDHLFAMVEYPTGKEFARGWQKAHGSLDYRQWEADSHAAGLTSVNRFTMINLSNGSVPAANKDMSASAPPHVLQFNEFDVGGKRAEFVDGAAKMETTIRQLAGDDSGDRRQWTISWAGEHANNVVATVEFSSHDAMIRTVEDVDFSPVFLQAIAQGAASGMKRVFECVMTETRP